MKKKISTKLLTYSALTLLISTPISTNVHAISKDGMNQEVSNVKGRVHGEVTIVASSVSKYQNDPLPTKDEFNISAVDEKGNEVDTTIDMSRVHMRTPGRYDVIISAENAKPLRVQVRVQQNQQKISARNAIRYQNDQVSEDIFNSSAKDKAGNDIKTYVDMSKVDVSKVGKYPVVIVSQDGQIKVVSLQIIKDNSSFEVTAPELHVGDKTPTKDDFKVKITDKAGNPVDYNIDTSTIDTSKAGDYSVVVTTADNRTKTVQCKVLENIQNPEESSIVVKYVDQDNKEIANEDVLIGKKGQAYETKAKEIKNYKLVEEPEHKTGTFENKGETLVYRYELAKESQPENPAKPNNPTKPNTPNSDNKVNNNSKKSLPKTGENISLSSVMYLGGVLVLLSTLSLVAKKRIY